MNQYSPEVDKQLFVRLYQTPIFIDGCFEETHGACQYKYFLTVSTFDEYPETNIFTLSTVGELEKISWIETAEVDTARLEFLVNKFSSDALANNDSLVNIKTKVQIKVTPKNINEKFDIELYR